MRKKLLTYLLIFTLCLNAATPVTVNASGFEGAVLGAGGLLSPPTAIAVALLAGGVLVGTGYVSEHWDDISQLMHNDTVAFEHWLENAKNRVIDTASPIFDKLVNFGKSLADNILDDGINHFEGSPTIIRGSYDFIHGMFNDTHYLVSASDDIACARLIGNDQTTYYFYSFASDISAKIWDPWSVRNPVYATKFTTFHTDADKAQPIYYVTFLRKTNDYLSELDDTAFASSLPVLTDSCYDFLQNVITNTGDAQVLGIPEELLEDGQSREVINVVDGSRVLDIPDTLDVDKLLELVGAGAIAYDDAIEALGAMETVKDITGDEPVVYPVENGAISDIPVSIPISDVDFEVHGLDDIFPFCIPFDIYGFLNAFSASPEAPHFVIPIIFEGSYPVDIDLSIFDNIASALRSVELVGFCVGLALVTRNLIRG